jgi:hypothetical protein
MPASAATDRVHGVSRTDRLLWRAAPGLMGGVRQSPSPAMGVLQRPQCHGPRAGRETARLLVEHDRRRHRIVRERALKMCC